jgi:adenylate cyclase
MAQDDIGTVASLEAARSVFRSEIELHRGRVVDTAGDSVLAIFETAAGAVSTALAVQRQLEDLATGVPADRCLRFRIGVHLGDVIQKPDGTVYGDGVNIAARLQSLALPGGVAVSDAVQAAVRHRIAATFEDLGEQHAKNIDPLRVYRVAEGRGADGPGPRARSRRWPASSWRHSLRWLTAATLAIAATWAGIRVMERVAGEDSAHGAPLLSVAVLPIKAGSAIEAGYAESFTRDLTSSLGTAVLFSPVIAHVAMMSHRDNAGDARAIGKLLNVRYLVEGDVSRDSRGDLGIGLRLIEAREGKQLWGKRLEVPEASVRDWPVLPVARSTAELRVALYEVERRRLSREAHAPSATELVFSGFNSDWSTAQSLHAARERCEKGLRLDPDLSEAATCMASTITTELRLGPNRAFAEMVRQADDLTARAVTRSPSYAYGWYVRGEALFWQKRWEAALDANARAIELDPSRSTSLDVRASIG